VVGTYRDTIPDLEQASDTRGFLRERAGSHPNDETRRLDILVADHDLSSVARPHLVHVSPFARDVLGAIPALGLGRGAHPPLVAGDAATQHHHRKNRPSQACRTGHRSPPRQSVGHVMKAAAPGSLTQNLALSGAIRNVAPALASFRGVEKY
jgi:hypothetical protein